MEEILAGPTALLVFVALAFDLLGRLWHVWQSAKKAVKSRRENQNDIIYPPYD